MRIKRRHEGPLMSLLPLRIARLEINVRAGFAKANRSDGIPRAGAQFLNLRGFQAGNGRMDY
jgi:hypothetical protein